MLQTDNLSSKTLFWNTVYKQIGIIGHQTQGWNSMQ